VEANGGRSAAELEGVFGPGLNDPFKVVRDLVWQMPISSQFLNVNIGNCFPHTCKSEITIRVYYQTRGVLDYNQALNPEKS
jgi:hypothetical protein